MDITFDKYEYIQRLKASGVDEAQAAAHAEALEQALKEKVATKFDIEILRRDLKIWTGTLAAFILGTLIAIKYLG